MGSEVLCKMFWSLQKLSLSSNFPIWGKKLHFQRWEAAQKYFFLGNLHTYIFIALFFLLTGLGTGGISVSPLFRSSMRDCQGAISFHPDFEIVTWFEMQLKAEDEQKTPGVHLHQAPPPLQQAHHLLFSLWFTILSLIQLSFLLSFSHSSDHFLFFISKRDCKVYLTNPATAEKCWIIERHTRKMSLEMFQIYNCFPV